MKRGKTSSMFGQSWGQMKLSFGMIFSIIMIIVFVGFAFYAIKTFLGLQDSTEIGTFIGDLQSEINKAWKSEQVSQEKEYSLPSEIESVCFVDDEYENLFFRSDEFFEGGKINYIDILKTTATENPFCIENKDGKIKIRLEKDFGEAMVTITR